MNMKNIIKNKQKELMQGMIALILCMALFCSAAAYGENDGSEWKMRHDGQKYEETGTDGQVQIPLYAGILAEFRTNEMAILADNQEILTRGGSACGRGGGTSGAGRLHIFTGTEVLGRKTGMVGRVVEPVCQGQLFW